MDQNRASFTDPTNEDEESVLVSGTDTDTTKDVAVSVAEITEEQDFKRIEGLPGVGGNETSEPSSTKNKS